MPNILIKMIPNTKGGGLRPLGEYRGAVPRKGERVDVYTSEGLSSFTVSHVSWSIVIGASDRKEDSCDAEIFLKEAS